MAPEIALTLAFSTMGHRLNPLLTLLNTIVDIPGCEIVVVVQKPDSESFKMSQLYIEYPNVKFICSDTVGLTLSRNLALNEAKGSFVWLLDDDVLLESQAIRTVLDMIKSVPAPVDIMRVRVGCTEDRSQCYKRYNNKAEVNRLMLLQMNSIELIVRRQFLVDTGVQFNRRLGLGAKYPACEEANFLLDAYSKGARFKLIHNVLIWHPCDQGGRRKVENKEIMEIRGATASRYGFVGLLLMLRWGLRYFLRDKKISFVAALVTGYLNKYKNYTDNA